MAKLTNVRVLVVHHTAQPGLTVADIDRIHRRKGWHGCGYHWCIGDGKALPDGHIAQGRPESEVGAAVALANSGKLHVVLVGQFHRHTRGFTGPPTRRQLSALGHWLLVKARQYRDKNGKPPEIRGHREVALRFFPTACPGSEMDMKRVRLWFARNFPRYLATGQPYEGLHTFMERE